MLFIWEIKNNIVYDRFEKDHALNQKARHEQYDMTMMHDVVRSSTDQEFNFSWLRYFVAQIHNTRLAKNPERISKTHRLRDHYRNEFAFSSLILAPAFLVSLSYFEPVFDYQKVF